MRKSIGAAVPPMDFLIRRHRPFYRKGRQIRWNYRKRKRTGPVSYKHLDVYKRQASVTVHVTVMPNESREFELDVDQIETSNLQSTYTVLYDLSLIHI